MRINRNSYLQKTRFFFPQVGEKGQCMGHAYLGVHALLTLQLHSFDRRLDSIAFGLPSAIRRPNQVARYRLEDLEKLIEGFNLEEQVKKYLSETNEDTSNVIQNTESPTVDNSTERLIDLIKMLGLEEIIPSIIKPKDSNEPQNNVESFLSDELNVQELKKQIDLSWAMRKAYLQQSFEKSEAKAIKTYGAEKAKHHSEEIKQEALNNLKLFDSIYPQPLSLINLEIYFSNIALHQSPQHFPLLFEKHKEPKAQKSGLFVPLLAPVDLDDQSEQSSGIEKFVEFSRNFNLEKLQIYFDSLADEINKSSLKDKEEDNSPLEALPFAFTLTARSHMVTIGYNIQNGKWILIDANQPPSFEIEQQHIAKHIMSALGCFQKFIFFSSNSYASIAFDDNDDKWVLLDSAQRIPTEEELAPNFDKLIQALITSPHLKKLTDDFQLNINTKVYLGNKYRSDIKSIISAWQQTQAFEKINQLSSEDINGNSKDKESLLHFACRMEDLNTVEKFIQAKADINQMEVNPHTSPLAWAIIFDHKEIVKLLLENNANPNQSLTDGKTPLSIAAAAGQTEIMDMLIKAGADINSKAENDLSALEIAVGKNQPTAVTMLLKNQAKSDLTECQNIEESSLFNRSKSKKITKILNEYHQNFHQEANAKKQRI